MNKDKVMNQLMDIRELTGGADSPKADLKKDLMAIRNISSNSIEELNSKPIMPPAFDEWKKQYLNNRCELLYWIAELESGGEESKQDNDLSDWLFENGIDDTFFHRYQMCVEAIFNGYEVGK